MFTRRLHSEGCCSLLLLKRLQKLNTKYSSSASQKSYQVDPKCFELLDRDMKKRIFNTVLWENDSDVSYMKRRNVTIEKYKREKFKLSTQGAETPTPLTLKLLEEVDANTMDVGAVTFGKTYESVEEKPPQYPFAKEGETSGQCFSESGNRSLRANNRIRSDALLALEEKKNKMNEWMSYYEYYDDVGDESSRFGTSDPNEPVSRVSCGGCGALLHCQDISIPGYLPKELFAGRSLRELKSMICQRCHFLKHFNVALDVSVKPEEYSKIISCIKEKYAIAVIMVDLLDFPCSIWPDMMDIVGTKRPVLIVGNKVDLIPGDQSGYLKHLEETLQLYVEKMGVAKANIKSVCLISARTGFGVEDLITKLQDLWESKHRQDVYLLGCTNVGKSTLFNRLLQSDFCKTQARDLVQRATTSLWPGTTLNLLKFPILRPDGWRLALRKKRLLAANRILKQENQLKQQQLKRHRMYHMPSFLQFVGKTFYDTELQENQDTFCIKEGKPKMGIWERHNDYVHGRWCFDTPGVVHPDQILNILTTEELLKVIPRSPIIPRFFTIKPGKSLLLAGLGRIDFISSSLDRSSRAVVFSSENLPVTIVPTCEVEDVYQKLVGSDLFAVPFGGPRRLADWPGLQSKDQIIKLEGIGWMECCADVVLSSAGWISVCGDEGMEMSFRAWTPFARGIHVREPALLPFAIHFKGKRINQTPTYRTTRADGTVPN